MKLFIKLLLFVYLFSDNVNDNSPLTQELRVLNKLAKIFRKKRIEAGALELSSPDIKFVKSKDKEQGVCYMLDILKQ
jgi:exosome complex exonuclease DIS3/RRP44